MLSLTSMFMIMASRGHSPPPKRQDQMMWQSRSQHSQQDGSVMKPCSSFEVTRHNSEAAVAYTNRSSQNVSQMEKPRVIRIMEFAGTLPC